MEVILLENMEKLGQVGDVARVKDGFARNYLLPQKKALRATNENKKVFEAQRKELEKQNKEKHDAAEALAKKLDGEFINVIRQAGEDGRLYGSVSARDIAAEFKKEEVDRRLIRLNAPIKATGVHQVTVALFAGVYATLNVVIARSEAEAKEAKADFLNPKKREEPEAVVEAKEAPKEEAPKEEAAAESDAEKGEKADDTK